MASDAAPPPRPGSRHGAFEILGLVGAGGMGAVYRARDARLGRDVALKILPPGLSADADRLARFEREARVLASLNHPNIATIHGIEESTDQPPIVAIVMELVDGETLAERLRRGALPIGEALRIARDIAIALDAAHRKNIVHRDLKPGNVKITADGSVKLLDFGLAKITAGEAEPGGQVEIATTAPTITVGGTAAGLVMGTPQYMSPEQARGLPVDEQTDIWAFGCMLYELLCGRPAFTGPTLTDILAAIVEREPDWSALPPATPPGIRRLLGRCLTKDAVRRLHHIADARLDIEEAIELGGRVELIEAAGPGRQPRRLAVAAGTAALVTALAVGWVARSRAPAAPANPLATATFQRLTSWAGSEHDAAISPDGRFVVFVSNREGPYDVWVTQVGTVGFTNLTRGKVPYILNDRIRNVGFTSSNEVTLVSEFRKPTEPAVTETYALPLTGGPMRRVLDRGVEAAWSPDGSRFVYHESGPGDPMFVVDTSGRDARQIYAATGGVHAHNQTWSPDGRWIYFVQGVPPEEMDIWRVAVDGSGAPEQVTFHNTDLAYPAFIDERTLLYRALAEDGSGPWLYMIDVERPQPTRVTLGVEQYLSIAAASSGRRLVATVSNPTSGLWEVPIASKIVDDQAALPIQVPNVRALSPRFGPDGIWYLSSDGGVNGLWRTTEAEAHEIWRPGDGGLPVPPALSPRGDVIAFLRRRGGGRRLFLMNADGTNLRPLSESLEVRDAPSWSPDGQWLAVSTGSQLMKIAVDGRPPVTLVEGSARIPIWSPDGRFILYSESIQGGPVYPVKAVTPEGQPFSVPPFIVRRSGDRYRVLPNGRQVVFIVGDYGRQQFWMIDLVNGERRQLTDFSPGYSIQGFDVSPDGTRILFDRIAANSDVVLIDLP